MQSKKQEVQFGLIAQNINVIFLSEASVNCQFIFATCIAELERGNVASRVYFSWCCKTAYCFCNSRHTLICPFIVYMKNSRQSIVRIMIKYYIKVCIFWCSIRLIDIHLKNGKKSISSFCLVICIFFYLFFNIYHRKTNNCLLSKLHELEHIGALCTRVTPDTKITRCAKQLFDVDSKLFQGPPQRELCKIGEKSFMPHSAR